MNEQDSLARPTAPPVRAELIPVELKNLARWVCWRYARDEWKAKWNKQPVSCRTKRNADITNPKVMGTFEEAMAFYQNSQGKMDGVGIALFQHDPFKAAGYFGLEISTTYHPDRRAGWGMLVGSLRRGLEMVDRGSRGRPFDTFQNGTEGRRKVEEIILLAGLGLGLVMKRGPKVERLTEGRANRPAPGVEPLAPQLAGFCYRPRPNA